MKSKPQSQTKITPPKPKSKKKPTKPKQKPLLKKVQNNHQFYQQHYSKSEEKTLILDQVKKTNKKQKKQTKNSKIFQIL